MTAPILAALQPLKDAVEHYNRELMRVRDHQLKEAAQVSAAAQRQDTNWLNAEVRPTALPKGVQLRWQFKIVNPNLVPNGYWVIDEGAIKADIAQGVREIPGVRIYEDVHTTFRS